MKSTKEKIDLVKKFSREETRGFANSGVEMGACGRLMRSHDDNVEKYMRFVSRSRMEAPLLLSELNLGFHAWLSEQAIRFIECNGLGKKAGKTGSTTRNEKNAKIVNKKRVALKKENAKTAEVEIDTEDDSSASSSTDPVISNDQHLAILNFYVDQADDTLTLADSISHPSLEKLFKLKSKLSNLAELHGTSNFDDSVKLFRKLENCADSVRSSLKLQATNQKIAKRRTILVQKIEAALENTELVYGKKFGGEAILGFNPMTDWKYVEALYMHKCLPEIKTIVLEEKVIDLASNGMALATYVTGGSRSGASFCISLHIWRRRPGRRSGPCLDRNDVNPTVPSRPAMNTEDWYFTPVTCSVLHLLGPNEVAARAEKSSSKPNLLRKNK